ncbi:MAG: hypothetical protein HQL40_20665 [Alphaproteobacteria bacterium]|nr:hypothetical protein [Alphaproteobacteria bacterium]
MAEQVRTTIDAVRAGAAAGGIVGLKGGCEIIETVEKIKRYNGYNDFA